MLAAVPHMLTRVQIVLVHRDANAAPGTLLVEKQGRTGHVPEQILELE